MVVERLRAYILAGILLFSAILLANLAINSVANDHYVAQAGSTFTSIQAAIDAASPGDTIYVENGTYYENLYINKTISLVGNGSAEVIGAVNQPTVLIEADFVNLTNLDILSRNFTGQEAVIIRHCDYVNISYCQVRDWNPSGYALYLWNSSHSTVFDTDIYKNGSYGAGLYTAQPVGNLSVTKCNIEINGTYAIGLYLNSIWDHVGHNTVLTREFSDAVDSYSYGIYSHRGHNSTFFLNLILTQGKRSHGIYLNDVRDSESVGNRIQTYGYGA